MLLVGNWAARSVTSPEESSTDCGKAGAFPTGSRTERPRRPKAEPRRRYPQLRRLPGVSSCELDRRLDARQPAEITMVQYLAATDFRQRRLADSIAVGWQSNRLDLLGQYVQNWHNWASSRPGIIDHEPSLVDASSPNCLGTQRRGVGIVAMNATAIISDEMLIRNVLQIDPSRGAILVVAVALFDALFETRLAQKGKRKSPSLKNGCSTIDWSHCNSPSRFSMDSVDFGFATTGRPSRAPSVSSPNEFSTATQGLGPVHRLARGIHRPARIRHRFAGDAAASGALPRGPVAGDQGRDNRHPVLVVLADAVYLFAGVGPHLGSHRPQAGAAHQLARLGDLLRPLWFCGIAAGGASRFGGGIDAGGAGGRGDRRGQRRHGRRRDRRLHAARETRQGNGTHWHRLRSGFHARAA